MKENSKLLKNKKIITFAIFAVTYVLFCLMTLLPNISQVGIINACLMCAIVLVAMSGIVLYLFLSDKHLVNSLNNVLAICATLVLSYALILAVVALFDGMLYPAPLALCALTMSMLFSSSKCGFFANFFVIFVYYTSLIVFGENSNVDSNCLYVLIAGVVTSILASIMANEHFRRLTYIFIGFALSLVACVCGCIVFFIYSPTFVISELLEMFLFAACSGLINVMLMFLLVPVFELLFNIVSDFRLAEISSTSAPLLRQMYSEAPGTFNHSLTVANYCEACAVAIGENPFLARACAYYHDIGKMHNAKYFFENQMGMANPHDTMTPEASVATIKNHVIAGLLLAKEAKLPHEVEKAIVEHHGTMPIEFFYKKAQRYTDGQLSLDGFCYDGPRPTSKISAILMICDAAEAALRANEDKEKAVEILDKIVADRIELAQFDNCDITFRDINVVKSTIISTYQGVEHERIKYTNVKIGGDGK